jgi:hypothetical protein
VTNNPTIPWSLITDTLINDYEMIKESDNHWEVDPMMVTKMIEDQAEGDRYGQWARANYSWEGVEVPEKVSAGFTIGDYDPLTIPGDNAEASAGHTTVMDMPEDFTYTADIKSTIDDLPLGAQEWWGAIDGWDSEAQLALVKAHFEGGGVGVEEFNTASGASISIYPNPSNGVLTLSSESELNAAMFFDVTGRMVRYIELNGEFNRTLDISDLNNGMYILQVETVSGASSSSKFIKE